MKDYKIINYMGMRCFDVCLFTIINELYGSYKLALANTLCIDYHDDMNLQIGDRLTFPHYTIKLVESIYGLKIHCRKTFFIKSLQNYIDTKIINDCPIIISMDVYDCYWSTLYKKMHKLHYFLVLKKDENHYICCDPYYRLNCINIEAKQLLKLTKKVYYISERKNISINKQYKKSIVRCLNKMYKSKAYYGLNKLFEVLEKITSLDNTYYSTEKNDFWLSTFHQAIGYYIPGGRLLFSYYLEEINAFYKNPNISKMQDESNNLYKQWVAISGILMKSYLLNNYTEKKEAILKKVKFAIECEKNLMHNFITYLPDIYQNFNKLN